MAKNEVLEKKDYLDELFQIIELKACLGLYNKKSEIEASYEALLERIRKKQGL